jgi:hypothetical protein
MKKVVLDRRTFLRGMLAGAGVGIALPALDIMFEDDGSAFAGGEPIPTRFGVWFWGNGVRREHWIPDGEGTDWTPRSELEPLNSVRDWLSPVTGLEVQTATHAHHSGMAGIMTGARYEQVGTTRDTIVSTFARQSIDQVAADHFSGQAPFRSLEVGVTRFWGTDEGTTFQHLSHNGPNNVNPSEYSPSAVFNRLFGGPPPDAPRVTAARLSVLDVVGGQVQRLQSRLGVRDRQRLDQHLTSIREIERRLQTEAPQCTTPANPGDFSDEGDEPIAEKNQAMSELVAMALACDLTRVFTVLFSTAGSGVRIWQVGANNSLHQINHDEAPPAPTVHACVVYEMQMLEVFLRTLRDTPCGPDGQNVLDFSSILCTTELSEGWDHTNTEFPILVAGKAGGRLRGGYHYRSQSNENASKALLTVLRAAGLPLTEFGVEGGYTNETITAIESA